MAAGGPLRPVLPLLLLLLPAFAGCFHDDEPEGPIEREVAVLLVPTLKEGNVTKVFELTGNHSYWRTDLDAVKRDAVTMEAVGPDGTRYESVQGDIETGFEPMVRVDDPQPGVWNLTIHARDLIEGEVRILVPDDAAAP